MTEASEWSERLNGLSKSLTTVEEAAASFEDALAACDRFLVRVEAGRVSDDILQGVQIGLSFVDAFTWLNEAPHKLDDLRETIGEIDAAVVDGELPATAHSWRPS